MSLILFIALAFCLFLLPLVPALLELSHATDAKPIKVVQEYDSDIRHFAKGFKSYFDKNFGSVMASLPQGYESAFEGTLEDNTMFHITGKNGIPVFNPEEMRNASTAKLIISEAPLNLPGKMFFESEIYGKDAVRVGDNSQVRALLGEKDVTLEEGCTVTRWVHSNGTLTALPGCNLMNRASADALISVGENCRFERLNAKKIQFGGAALARPERAKSDLTTLTELPNTRDQFERRWLINGDLSIPANSFFDGDIVASGNVTIGEGSYVRGSIKANKDLILAADARVDGSLFAIGDIEIDSGCHVTGPVVAEETVAVKSGSSIGVEILPTTLSAPRIHVAPGVTVFGTIWADEQGTVAAA